MQQDRPYGITALRWGVVGVHPIQPSVGLGQEVFVVGTLHLVQVLEESTR